MLLRIVKLFYNDYNEYEDRKCDFIIEILTELKAKGLVDGMGMQSHWVMDYPSISMFEKSIRRYAALGLEIQLTELDIRNPDNSQWALERQANRYKELVTKLVDLKKRRHKHYGIGILGNNRRDKLAWRISAPV